MGDMKEPLSDQVFHNFLAVLRYRRQYAHQIMNEQGLKQRQFSVLRMLLESGPATVGQVQIYLHNSASTTSTLIAQLEKAGYVTRNRSQVDNRVVIVDLTPSGRDIAENTPLGGLPLLRRRLGKLSEERLVQIDDVITEIMQLMGAPDIE
jgi:DNA-binding MarR family transcriptional regulator